MATFSEPRATSLAVRVENATVSFPARAGSLVALDGCSLEAPAGSFTVVIGPERLRQVDAAAADRRPAAPG